MSLVPILIPTYGCVALLIYALFLYIYKLNYTKQLKDNAFYLLVPSMAVGDLGQLVFYTVYTLVNYVWVVPTFIDAPIKFLVSSFYYVIVYTSLAMAFNRYCILCWSQLGDALFSDTKQMAQTSAVVWTASFASTFVKQIVIDCDLMFLNEYGKLFYVCPNTNENATASSGDRMINLSDDQTDTILFILNVIPSIVAVLLIAFYTRCFIELYKQRTQTQGLSNNQHEQRRKRDLRLMLQGALIGLSMVLANVSFLFARKLPEGSPSLVVITNSLLTAIIFLIFNKIFRDSAKKILMFRSNTVAIM